MRSRFDSSRFDAGLIGMQWALRFVLLVMAALALAACSDDVTWDNPVASVQVTAAASLVEAGDSVLLSAAPKRVNGSIDPGVPVSWMSTDTSIATVQGRAGQKAVVVGKQPGTVSIRALADDKFGQTSIQVIVTEAQPAPVVTSIAPASATQGDPATPLTVTGQNFTELSVIHLNGEAIETQFISNTELRAVITTAKLAQVGTAEVTVRTAPPGGGTSAGKPFNILPRVVSVHVELPDYVLWVGEEKKASATPRDGAGNNLPKMATQWASTEPAVATVDEDGVVTPLKEGFTFIRATVNGVFSDRGIQVVAAPQYDLMFDRDRGNGERELWVVTLGANANPRRWLPGVLGEDAATSPDGNRIAFVRRDAAGNSDIWVANRDGSDLQQLTFSDKDDDQPAWSPDGTRIAFRSTRGVQSQIWIMDADGSHQRNLMGDSFNVFDAQQSRPTFGTNGRVYFQISYPWSTPASVLASIPVNGTWQNMVVHTPAGYSDSDPAVSYGGSTIMVRRRDGNTDYGIIYVDPNGTALVAINYPGPGFTPAWSRNDLWHAITLSDHDTNARETYVMQVQGFWRKRVTIGGGSNPVFIKR